MKPFIISILFFFQSHAVLGQQVYEQKIIPTGESLNEYFTFLFPAFEKATVLFKDHHIASYQMNFNTLLCVMQFINEKGDTLQISNPSDIDTIKFDNSSFFYDKGYYQIVAGSDLVKLVVLRHVSYETVTLGAMGLPVHSKSALGLSDFIDADTKGRTPQLTLRQDIYVYDQTNYMLFTLGGRLDAVKNNFLQVFANRRQEIENYLSKHKTHFNKLPDLENLFQFCIGK